jgi:hypothetical protein
VIEVVTNSVATVADNGLLKSALRSVAQNEWMSPHRSSTRPRRSRPSAAAARPADLGPGRSKLSHCAGTRRTAIAPGRRSERCGSMRSTQAAGAERHGHLRPGIGRGMEKRRAARHSSATLCTAQSGRPSAVDARSLHSINREVTYNRTRPVGGGHTRPSRQGQEFQHHLHSSVPVFGRNYRPRPFVISGDQVTRRPTGICRTHMILTRSSFASS